LGRTPTEAEKKAALKDKGDKFLKVTPEEIGKLLDSGEVVSYAVEALSGDFLTHYPGHPGFHDEMRRI
jgi:hypothetical protein